MLNVANNSVSSLAPLQKMRELKFLNISNNSVGSLDALKSTPKLMNVHLEGNNLKVSTSHIAELRIAETDLKL